MAEKLEVLDRNYGSVRIPNRLRLCYSSSKWRNVSNQEMLIIAK